MNKLILLSFLVFISCNSTPGKTDPVNSNPDQVPVQQNSDVLTVKIFNNDTVKTIPPRTGFGYDIYRNTALYIHQPNIPAVTGNSGFSTAENAYKTATLAVYKIQNNIMPPSISTQELDSLGVLK